jgi:hypothetical protein
MLVLVGVSSEIAVHVGECVLLAADVYSIQRVAVQRNLQGGATRGASGVCNVQESCAVHSHSGGEGGKGGARTPLVCAVYRCPRLHAPKNGISMNQLLLLCFN